jgi:glycosyltransferase involved in cell wall biosynthesis
VCLDVRLGISDADLVDLLNWAALVLYVPYLEPFGLVPIEAGACGAPVVGIAEGGLRETIVHDQTGLLVERDPAAVAGAINRLRSDEHLARRLGQAAAQRVRDVWTTRHAVDRIEAHLLDAARAG